jgi:hypothetical protein
MPLFAGIGDTGPVNQLVLACPLCCLFAPALLVTIVAYLFRKRRTPPN